MQDHYLSSLQSLIPDPDHYSIAEKIINKHRISAEEGILLYDFSPGLLSMLATYVNYNKNKDRVGFIRNFHLEPTNICTYHCLFCSYSRQKGDHGAWLLSEQEIDEHLRAGDPLAREIHITGGAHPEWMLEQYGQILDRVRRVRPELHIKAFSAVEIFHMMKSAGKQADEIMQFLKDKGLHALPGGGAEIFHPEIRRQICPEKVDAEGWLKIHETAHRTGISSNATMLYGHIEQREHRIDHMSRLRELQDCTGGFQAFIPLKFRNKNNKLSSVQECSLMEDLKTYAISRIYLDNFRHLKSYWPMLGKEQASMSLHFGVDDLDGTISDTTSIYSTAGQNETSMSSEELISLIQRERKHPYLRDALYKEVTG